MSIYLGEIPLANNNVSRNIGEIVASTLPITDTGLHLLDGSLISGNGAYSKFVTYIASLVSGYPDLFDTEANWQTSVANYGVCGKFVYDSVNNTVRLPKITGFTEGTIDPTTLGDLTQAGLPNIEGMFASGGGCPYSWTRSNGCFTAIHGGKSTSNSGGSGQGDLQVNFSASASNSIYGNSTTVQPQSIKVLYYIVIANSVKTNIEVDIDEIATDLNGKADVDLSNVNVSGTSLASGWSMPSSRYIDLTLGASGSTYTAPANGYFCVNSNVTGSWISLWNTSNEMRGMSNGGYIGLDICIICPVKKGDTMALQYDGTWSPNSWQHHPFIFIYAEGEN